MYELHRSVNGVDIEEDVFRSRYIAAGLERIFACSSGSESGIALLLLFRGALDLTTEVEPQVAWNQSKAIRPRMHRIGCKEHMTPRTHDAKKKRSIRCTACTA